MLNKIIFITFLTSFKTCGFNYVQYSSNSEKIIMDVDAGADDAFGIILNVLNEEHFKGPPVIAITCVNGNTNLKNVITNVFRTLEQLKRTDIPVYAGADSSLVEPMETDHYFGEDGFGDFQYTLQSPIRITKEHASLALIRLVNENPGQITLFGLGPLTNIALAVKLDPNFINKLKKLVIFGGSVMGVGNVKPGLEFNFCMDPESMSIVLRESNHTKVTLITWDLIFLGKIPYDWRRNSLGILPNSNIQFLNKAENITMRTVEHWECADAIAVATYMWPSIILKSQPLIVSPVTSGKARGGLLTDWYFADRNKNFSNVNVVLDIDTNKYKKLLLQFFRD